MKFTYINLDGNKVETEDLVNTPSYLIKIDNTYFEKRVEEVKVATKKEQAKVEKVVEVTETIVDPKDETVEETTAPTTGEDFEARAKEFLKDKKVRGFGLLKGQKIIDKAVELGFTL